MTLRNCCRVLSVGMYVVVVAEWLRRWTRNPLGSPRAGSNPVNYAFIFPLSTVVPVNYSRHNNALAT